MNGTVEYVKKWGFRCTDCKQPKEYRPWHRLARLTPKEIKLEPLCRTCWHIYQGITGDRP